jgi:twitching motility two-component system response regulator PilH
MPSASGWANLKRIMASKILVADASPTLRNIARSLLSKHGYEVLSAQDGAEALQVARSGRPDVMFLDESLPVMDGEQVLKELKHDRTLKDVPVVVLLTKEQPDRKRQFQRMGTDSFLAKPLNPAQILAQAERCLSQLKPMLSGEVKSDSVNVDQRDPAKSDRVEQVEVTLPGTTEEKPPGDLDIVTNSDLVKSGDSSLIGADESAAHGFEWFLDELKRETHEKPPAAPKLPSEEHQTSKAPVQHDQRNDAVEAEDAGAGFDEFVKELKYDEQGPEEGQAPRVEFSVLEGMGPSDFNALISSLTERIPLRVAQEVAEMVTPELLERIIREELIRMRKGSS